MTTPDPQYLRNEQYKDASKLAARAHLHANYSRNPVGWFTWMFDLYQFPAEAALPEDARILEIGAGPGWMWAGNAERIPPGLQITLSDFSPGMLDEARKNLANVAHNFQFEEIDAQSIPYPDSTFDAVIANHMLYHVPDRAKAIAEMRRVLKPSGTLYTATNGDNHLQEIHQLMYRFGLTPQEWFGGFVAVRGYTLENAPAQLKAQFGQVETRLYDDAIELDNAEPLIAYIQSYPVRYSDEQIARLPAFIQAEIGQQGKLTITKSMGVLIARA